MQCLGSNRPVSFISFCWSTAALPKALHLYYSFKSTITNYILLYTDCTELRNSGSWTNLLQFEKSSTELRNILTWWVEICGFSFPLMWKSMFIGKAQNQGRVKRSHRTMTSLDQSSLHTERKQHDRGYCLLAWGGEQFPDFLEEKEACYKRQQVLALSYSEGA